VSLCLEAGESVAIMGPSGAGKTTLLSLIGALDSPSAGSVQLGGREISDLRGGALARVRARQIGFVFQDYHLLPYLTALENVAEGMVYRGLTRVDRLDRAARALVLVGLGHRLAHRPGALSGGERQRAAIARAIAGGPQLLLADEPTGALDGATGAEVIDLMVRLADEGMAVLIVTHNPDVAARLQRTVRLADGRIAGLDPAERPSSLPQRQRVDESHASR
jgi:putative ABC transport system ATP-binding protein